MQMFVGQSAGWTGKISRWARLGRFHSEDDKLVASIVKAELPNLEFIHPLIKLVRI
jgi:hypothetical protein